MVKDGAGLCLLHALMQIHSAYLEDDVQSFVDLYVQLTSGRSSLKRKLGVLRASFIMWTGRSSSVTEFFTTGELLDCIDSVFSFIRPHVGA